MDKVPFSAAGSYMALSQLPSGAFSQFTKKGLYLRSVHGAGYMPGFTMMRNEPFCARIYPVWKGQEIEYKLDADFFEVRLLTAHGRINLCFTEENFLLITGSGEGMGINLELVNGNFLQSFRAEGKKYLTMNCRAADSRFAVYCQAGALEERKSEDERELLCGRVQNGKLLLQISDMGKDWLPCKTEYSYEECRERNKIRFEKFQMGLPHVEGELEQAGRLAAYVCWSGIVKKNGILTRDAMLMSKNQMCNVWSWDHCFNAIALSFGNPEMAWEQFLLLFDYQDACGALPDSISDTYEARAFTKPPIHGWALSEMLRHMKLDEKQCRTAFEKLEKWTKWWLEFRDSDEDGICEYSHGHDSGWDNSTAFAEGGSMELPDLAAFLILQMEMLSRLADQLGEKEKAENWMEKADDMLDKMIKHCFEDGKPIAVISGKHERVETDSLILYLPILLGRRLPETIRQKLIEELKSRRFLTDYGFASEAPASCRYEPDGYWRGPIWAPPTLFLVKGLDACGESDFARSIAEKFCKMVEADGFAENFNALTGEGLRDRAYTWTSSIFLILSAELCSTD